jgi:hypothetical protein
MLIRTRLASADIYLQARVPTTDGPTATLEGSDNIKVGFFPETITFDFQNQVQFYTIVYQDGTREKKALEYGLPDQLIWHNTEQENLKGSNFERHVQISGFKSSVWTELSRVITPHKT